MCCKTHQTRAAPKSRHVAEPGAGASTHTCDVCELRNNKAQGFTPGSMDTHRFGRPPAAAGTHMCVSEIDQRRAAPRVKVYHGWATQLCWKHTYVCCRTDEFRVAPQGQRLQHKVWPTSCCCEHSKCVLQSMSFQDCTQGSKGYKGLARCCEDTL